MYYIYILVLTVQNSLNHQEIIAKYVSIPLDFKKLCQKSCCFETTPTARFLKFNKIYAFFSNKRRSEPLCIFSIFIETIRFACQTDAFLLILVLCYSYSLKHFDASHIVETVTKIQNNIKTMLFFFVYCVFKLFFFSYFVKFTKSLFPFSFSLIAL